MISLLLERKSVFWLARSRIGFTNMKVLLSAYSCEHSKGSERGVGWNVAREVAKYHEVPNCILSVRFRV
jgi:hypothetical protein